MTYEVYMSKYKLELNDKNEIVKTEFLETGWFEDSETRHPRVPGTFYVPASDEFATNPNSLTIRLKVNNNRGGQQITGNVETMTPDL